MIIECIGLKILVVKRQGLKVPADGLYAPFTLPQIFFSVIFLSSFAKVIFLRLSLLQSGD